MEYSLIIYNDKTIKNSVDNDIIDKINIFLNEKIYIFENEFTIIMNAYIRSPLLFYK